MTRQPKVLFYDIESTYKLARVWRLGEQTIRHDQLVAGSDVTDIICIAYAWNDGSPVQSLNWDYTKQDSTQMIEKFDEIIKQADVVIGKNSDRFDNKHLNTQRLLKGLPPMPDWLQKTDDLEKQIKKYFKFESNSLDYVSKLLLGEGKLKMDFQDWVNIQERNKDGEASFKKMIEYCEKDVADTRDVWNKVEKHIQPKLNRSTFFQAQVCTNCGSSNIRANGTRPSGKTLYQQFFCNDHGGYAGRAPIKSKTDEGTRLG